MNWDRIEGNWKQFKGSMQQKWAKLTDDDVEYIQGAGRKLVGRLQERYGIAREEAEKQADAWYSASVKADRETRKTSTH